MAESVACLNSLRYRQADSFLYPHPPPPLNKFFVGGEGVGEAFAKEGFVRTVYGQR